MKESSARELGESSHLQEKKITHVVDILVLTHVLALTQPMVPSSWKGNLVLVNFVMENDALVDSQYLAICWLKILITFS